MISLILPPCDFMRSGIGKIVLHRYGFQTL